MVKTFLTSPFIALIALSLIFSSCTPPNELEEKSVPELTKLLKSEDSVMRAKAAMALGTKEKAAKEAIPAMIKLLGDKQAHVRSRTMNALAQLGTIAVPELIKAVEDRDRTIRFYAAHALKKIPDDKASKAYDAWMESEGKDLVSPANR